MLLNFYLSIRVNGGCLPITPVHSIIQEIVNESFTLKQIQQISNMNIYGQSKQLLNFIIFVFLFFLN